MSAAVTRRHREGAFAAMGVQFAAIHPYAATFLETGADPHDIYPIAARVAQLAADCEARGKHEAWDEGYLARSRRGLYADEPVNPYPKADEETDHE